jgi:hypothetical protein
MICYAFLKFLQNHHKTVLMALFIWVYSCADRPLPFFKFLHDTLDGIQQREIVGARRLRRREATSASGKWRGSTLRPAGALVSLRSGLRLAGHGGSGPLWWWLRQPGLQATTQPRWRRRMGWRAAPCAEELEAEVTAALGLGWAVARWRTERRRCSALLPRTKQREGELRDSEWESEREGRALGFSMSTCVATWWTCERASSHTAVDPYAWSAMMSTAAVHTLKELLILPWNYNWTSNFLLS